MALIYKTGLIICCLILATEVGSRSIFNDGKWFFKYFLVLVFFWYVSWFAQLELCNRLNHANQNGLNGQLFTLIFYKGCTHCGTRWFFVLLVFPIFKNLQLFKLVYTRHIGCPNMIISYSMTLRRHVRVKNVSLSLLYMYKESR